MWGGWCRPLERIDFEQRDWVPYSGWPFGKDHLDPYYERAQEVCGLGPYHYDLEDWRSGAQSHRIGNGDERLVDTVIQINNRRFGTKFFSVICDAANIKLLLHANAIDIETALSGREVTNLHVATLEGNHFKVAARIYILATGGIENARLLLASRRNHRNGVGNNNDLVGRFFNEHLHAVAAKIEPNEVFAQNHFYRNHKVDGVLLFGTLTLNERTLRQERLLNFSATFHNPDDPYDIFINKQTTPAFRSLARLARSIQLRKWPDMFGRNSATLFSSPANTVNLVYSRYVKPRRRQLVVCCRTEQVPNPVSRVVLGNELDALGVPKVKLDWRISDVDIASIQTGARILTEALQKAGIGRIYPLIDGSSNSDWVSKISDGPHQMGTTRMHCDPKLGVVDENCRIHGISNLYVAGTSVFPTVGWANPTLTVVALALRLADHLKQELR
jgi:choline dehydrogenase-like flavoprotein